MLKAPVDAIPPLAGKGVVPCSPAPGKISPWPGPTDPLPLTSMPAVLIVLLTKFTKLLAPKALPAVPDATAQLAPLVMRSEEHPSELQSLMRISYAVFCLNKKKNYHQQNIQPLISLQKT